jgi:sortase A
MYLEQKKLLHDLKTQTAAAEVLTKISIPRIGLRAIVLEGTSSHSLLLGPAHMSGSAPPGAMGNSVIAGHRDTFFRHIHSLKAGDDIYVVRSGRQFHYLVTAKRVVEPTDLSVLEPTRDGQLTLITCYPTHAIGPAPERLIVTAKLNSRRPLLTEIPDHSSFSLSSLLAGLD